MIACTDAVKIVKRRLEEQDSDDVVIEQEDGNVVRVNFGKTLGSA